MFSSPMRISVLASSSRGNASVIAAGSTALMVDAGISALRITRGLEDCGVRPAALQAIFITHEHEDHTKGLGRFAAKHRPPIYCSRYLRNDLRAIAPDSPLTYVEPGSAVQVGDIRVTPFAVSHDAADPLGYIFEHEGVRLGYITDTGRVTRQMESILAGVHALYIESNYDEDMLRSSGRPHYLISRISGPFGHLSNTQAGELVERLAHPELRHVILGHLSPECNTPACAERSMERILRSCSPSTHLHTALRDRRLDWVHLDGFSLEN